MKVRKSRQVRQGASNYNIINHPKTINQQSKTINHQTISRKIQHQQRKKSYQNIKNQQHSQSKRFKLSSCQSSVYHSSNKKNKQMKVFDRLYTSKCNKQCNLIQQKKMIQIISTLKNCCEYKNYQYFNIFKYFDQNNTGKVNQQQFIKLIKHFGYNINNQQARQIITYLNPNINQMKNKQQINQSLNYIQSNQSINNIQSNQSINSHSSVNNNNKQNQQYYFTLKDFVEGIGSFQQVGIVTQYQSKNTHQFKQLKSTQLFNKFSQQKQLKKRSCSKNRNNSINVKNLLVHYDGEQIYQTNQLKQHQNQNQIQKQNNQINQSNESTDQINYQQFKRNTLKKRPSTALQRHSYRYSKIQGINNKTNGIRFQDNYNNNSNTNRFSQNNHYQSGRILQQNPLIPRSLLRHEQQYQLRSSNFINKINHDRQSNNIKQFYMQKDTKLQLLKQTQLQKLNKKSRYERKLQIINQNRLKIQSKAKEQNKSNLQNNKFTQNWASLIQTNNWLRS